MRCPTCSNPLPPKARFCSYCGSALEEPSVAPTATSVPTPGPAGKPPGVETGRISRLPSSDTWGGDGRFVPGALLADRYRIVGLLGRGGMGEVYRADDIKLGQAVALKFLPESLAQDGNRLQRFLNEVRTARQIGHPNVCRVYDVGEVGGQHFLSMEYVDGEDLGSLLRRIGHIPRDKAIQIARQLCAGLAAAHAQGFVHRDLKPANIMIDGRGRVRITDFGLAGLTESFRGAEIRAGTPAYMAPEQLSGEGVTVRSDVYSLGLVLYEMFTGKPAFEAASATELIRMQQQTPPPSPASHIDSFDPVVEQVILRCLEKSPDRRPPNALVVSASLPGGDPLAAALAAGETPSPEMVAAAGGVGRMRPGIALAGLALAAAAIVGMTYIPGDHALIRQVDVEQTPEELRAEARRLVADVGYDEPYRDSSDRMVAVRDYLDHVEENDQSATRWAGLNDVRPAPVSFWYRQSPAPLVPTNNGSTVTPRDPPMTEGGMVRVRLNPDATLTEFFAIPPLVEETDSESEHPEPDWRMMFDRAGLDLDSAVAVEPRWNPRVNSDVRVAWEAPFRVWPDRTVRVEAAGYHGRPVFFKVVAPWTRPDRTTALQAAGVTTAMYVVMIAMLVVIAVGAVLLARRNLRLGRGDRRGAFRLAVGVTGMFFAGWLLVADHVRSVYEFGMMMQALGEGMLFGALSYVVYLALEPYVRRLWPDSLIAWNRLVDGRFRDPLLGRDVLIGAVVGLVVGLLMWALPWLPQWLGKPPSRPITEGMFALGALRLTAGSVVMVIMSALLNSMGILLLIVLLRTLIRRPWIAYTIVWLLFAGVGVLNTNLDLMSVFVSGAIWAIILLVLIRFGTVATVVMLTSVNLTVGIMPAFEPAAWYFPNVLLGLAVPLAFVVYGFIVTLSGQTVIRDELIPE